MIEVIVVLALIVLIGGLEWNHARERRYLINCLIARTANEARILNQTPLPPIPPKDDVDVFWDELVDADGFAGQTGI
jgi:hypothetical protein